jgi:HPt (histidine-containing phosphotransfer) domain-containing protein
MAEINGASGADGGAVYVNQREGLDRVMNNAKLYAKLLGKFKDETKLDGLVAAVNAGEYEKAQTEAHTLKGIAGNLALTELYTQIMDLETQIKSGAVAPGALGRVGRCLTETFITIDGVLKQYG